MMVQFPLTANGNRSWSISVAPCEVGDAFSLYCRQLKVLVEGSLEDEELAMDARCQMMDNGTINYILWLGF